MYALYGAGIPIGPTAKPIVVHYTLVRGKRDRPACLRRRFPEFELAARPVSSFSMQSKSAWRSWRRRNGKQVQERATEVWARSTMGPLLTLETVPISKGTLREVEANAQQRPRR